MIDVAYNFLRVEKNASRKACVRLVHRYPPERDEELYRKLKECWGA